MAGFVNPNTQTETSATMVNNSDDHVDNGISTDDFATALQDLDTLLTHITTGGLRLTANEFIEIDSEPPAFNEWNDIDDNLMVVNADCAVTIQPQITTKMTTCQLKHHLNSPKQWTWFGDYIF